MLSTNLQAQMAENNTKALIEALEEVMRDFNAKINEQFGENFKTIKRSGWTVSTNGKNSIVNRWTNWLPSFRLQTASIEKSRESLEIIAERSESIVSSSERLDPILQALQHQIQQLNNHLAAFSALADNAT